MTLAGVLGKIQKVGLWLRRSCAKGREVEACSASCQGQLGTQGTDLLSLSRSRRRARSVKGPGRARAFFFPVEEDAIDSQGHGRVERSGDQARARKILAWRAGGGRNRRGVMPSGKAGRCWPRPWTRTCWVAVFFAAEGEAERLKGRGSAMRPIRRSGATSRAPVDFE